MYERVCRWAYSRVCVIERVWVWVILALYLGIGELIATVVGDGGDEGGGFADEPQSLGPRVVHRDLEGGEGY